MQPGRDVNMLRTMLETMAATLAGRRLCGGRDGAIHKSEIAALAMIIGGKHARDVYPMRTGRAIAATGARDVA